MNPPIVAAVDGSAVSYQAAAWAAADAALHGCRLHLVTSVSIPAGYGPGAILTGLDTDWLRVEGERMLGEAARIARAAVPDAAPPISTEVSWSPVVPELIERSQRARMLVLGSHGVGALRRGLVGSVSSAMLRHAHCPVAVIHYESAADPLMPPLRSGTSGSPAVSTVRSLRSLMAMEPVVVGVDGSPGSMPALAAAFEEASLREVGLTAVHAWSDTPVAHPLSIDWDATMRDTESMLLAESLAGWSERYPDVTVRRVVVRDRPARALLEEARAAQLVVVGSHGRGGFAGMMLGATSNALVHSVECPILVVREQR